jgi:PEP-CTERM motif
VTFNLAGGLTFDNVEFNLFNGATSAVASFSILGSTGTTYNFTNNPIANGSNFFGFVGTAGETIKQVSYTVTGGGFVDQRQLRLDQAPTRALPEPATWASMLMGIGFAGAAMRRAKKTAGAKSFALV